MVIIELNATFCGGQPHRYVRIMPPVAHKLSSEAVLSCAELVS